MVFATLKNHKWVENQKNMMDTHQDTHQDLHQDTHQDVFQANQQGSSDVSIFDVEGNNIWKDQDGAKLGSRWGQEKRGLPDQ
ncbi:MAG: hypothetical protein LUI14_00695 [Lachnospiraceae bacterium]|nr:hypothetical protein [Lachnospiraceae bacterium]